MQFQGSVGSPAVIVTGVLGKDVAQVPLTEDQHPVGDLGPGREHEPLRVGVRQGTPRLDLHDGHAGVGEDRVEGRGELPTPISDQDLKVVDAVAEVKQEVAGLLGGPRPVGIGGDPEDVHVPGSDLHDEEDM